MAENPKIDHDRIQLLLDLMKVVQGYSAAGLVPAPFANKLLDSFIELMQGSIGVSPAHPLPKP